MKIKFSTKDQMLCCNFEYHSCHNINSTFKWPSGYNELKKIIGKGN